MKRRHSLILAVVLALTSFALGSVSPAGAASLPQHAPGAVFCDDSGTATITAYAPSRSYGYMYSFYTPPNRERVLWSSTLEFWNDGSWINYDTTSDPWHYAFANQNGLQSWQFFMGSSYVWSTSPNDGTSSDRHDYRVVYRGFYRVRNYFRWEGTLASNNLLAVRYNGVAGTSYCYIP